jgi:predicted ester cyclase
MSCAAASAPPTARSVLTRAQAPSAAARLLDMDDQAVHARTAIEQVCARGDLERARELYAPDFVDHVNALEFRGHDGIARSVALYRATFRDLRIDVLDQVAQKDRVVSRWRLQGTHRGRRVTLPGITISRFVDGKIAEDWTVSDNLTLLRRLGLRRALALAARYATGRLPGA